MERIIYIIIFAVVVLIFKAMFLDDYLKEREQENNVTTPAEIVETTESEPVTPAMVSEKKAIPAKKNEGMPIDELGDSIAEKLDKKL